MTATLVQPTIDDTMPSEEDKKRGLLDWQVARIATPSGHQTRPERNRLAQRTDHRSMADRHLQSERSESTGQARHPTSGCQALHAGISGDIQPDAVQSHSRRAGCTPHSRRTRTRTIDEARQGNHRNRGVGATRGKAHALHCCGWRRRCGRRLGN